LLNIFKFNTAGKIIYGSNAISTPVPQMFVQQVGSNNPPTQFCQSSFAPRWPAWSPNGKYVAYVTTDVIVSNPPGYLETVRIVDLACNTVAGYYQWDVGRSLFNYPEWKPDGRGLLITAHDNWADRELAVIDFADPYDFGNYSVRTLVPPAVGPN